MQLLGPMNSPYVRRVAICWEMLGIDFQHQPLSLLENSTAFQQINPVMKAPTLILDDGSQLVDSQLIIDYGETLCGRSLLPAEPAARLSALKIIGLALVANEKSVQLIYEFKVRPAERQFPAWEARLRTQLQSAYRLLETALSTGAYQPQLEAPGQAEITLAVAWTFSRFAWPELIEPAHYPAIGDLSEQIERRPAFRKHPIDPEQR